jgi:hypothetical protein
LEEGSGSPSPLRHAMRLALQRTMHMSMVRQYNESLIAHNG